MTDLIKQAEAFARERHKGQIRKGAAAEEYMVHVADVASRVQALGGNQAAICAAWLHDTVEDCPPTSVAELAGLFGAQIAGFVAELTDDKALPKAERKRLQRVNAPAKSATASLVKIADKTSNVTALRLSPPAHWPVERKLAYIDWAEDVVGALGHQPAAASTAFKAACVASRASVLLLK